MSTVRFDGVAMEDIKIGAAVSVEMDTATGRMTVRAARPSGEARARAGEAGVLKPGGAWRIESAVEDWGGKTWDLVDDRGGRWGNFPNRTTATACIAGFKAIGFVPRPGEIGPSASNRSADKP